MTRASGIGSWPGVDVREAIVTIRDLFAEQLPYLPETPARGPGAELIGRGAGLLVDLPVDLQPSGWRLVDRPGRDAARTASLLTQDLDELAEAYQGWSGPLKIQLAGPWTLAAGLSLPRGERVLSDPGATAEIVQSLAEGARRHCDAITRLVPGATLTVQVDEPSLPAVLAGDIPSASGYGRMRAVDPRVASEGLAQVIAGLGELTTLVHCCHPKVPIPVIRDAGAGGVAVDTTLLTAGQWESIAVAIEDGMTLYAGAVASDGSSQREEVVRSLLTSWERLGLTGGLLDEVTVTSNCGLAGLTSSAARNVCSVTVDCARELTDRLTS